MAEIGACLGDVCDHLAHRARIRTRGLHQILRFADLRGRDHFERARHLAHVLRALDLGFDFASAGHALSARYARWWEADINSISASNSPLPTRRYRNYQLPVFLYSSSEALKVASMSLFQSPVATILVISSSWFWCMNACRPFSNGSTLLTGRSSR